MLNISHIPMLWKLIKNLVIHFCFLNLIINKGLGFSEKEMVLMFNHTDINDQKIPVNRLKDLITDWNKMEEKALDVENESNIKKFN